MAVNFIARKCACGGKLEFDPAKKIWICKYCGTVVEREATFDKVQVDGIEGINDVVRQTLMDVANNKMESAGRNLEDCERKNHKHVGTLIANISYNLAMISMARSQEEARGYLDKVKLYAKRLNEEYPSIAEDEINMYEAFGEGVADIYANLLVVFDTLNDGGRVEYISSRLKPAEIFSEHANGTLLKISLKRENYDVAETVLRNTNHIDRKSGLQELMLHYPDNGRKQELLGLVFRPQTAGNIPRNFFEQYFTESGDSIRTKAYILRTLAGADIKCNAEAVARALHGQMEGYDTAKEAFSALYEAKVSDQETEAILVFCLMENQSHEVIKAFFDALLEKGVFVQLNSRAVISYLDGWPGTVNEKLEVLERMFRFEVDGKSKDAVYNYYLNNNRDPYPDRIKVIDFLLTDDCPIFNTTTRNYILRTSVDGEGKPAIVEKIFETGINKTYLGDLLSEYLLSSADPEEVKAPVSDCLIGMGFKVDSNVLTQYVTSNIDAVDARIEKARRLIANGTSVKADCLENYILSVKEPEDFSERMFNLLAGYSFAVGFAAYARFLLFCKDIDKVRHHAKLAGSLSGDLNGTQTTVKHGMDSVVCNLLQAYVLTSGDSYDVAKAIVEELLGAKIKLNTEVTVNGNAMKFKKYVGERKALLSPLTLQLCEENRMFSLF